MSLSTAYYTVDGEIIGESSSGNRLDYLTDALGSVTGKADQASAAVSSARYKPFGEKLLGPDYNFGWVGSYGYRTATTGSYVRARHYSHINGGWTSLDRLWPTELAYTYVQGSVTTLTDLSGNSPILEKLCEYYWPICTDPVLISKLTLTCYLDGTVPCYFRAGVHTNEELPSMSPSACQPGECCVQCKKTCKTLRGVMCTGKTLLDCAKEAAKKFTGKGDNVANWDKPKVDDGTDCDRICSPSFDDSVKGKHYQWKCNPSSKGVITALCCPCYEKGAITMRCNTTQGCHTKGN